jgi:hypothetical protein
LTLVEANMKFINLTTFGIHFKLDGFVEDNFGVAIQISLKFWFCLEISLKD